MTSIASSVRGLVARTRFTVGRFVAAIFLIVLPSTLVQADATQSAASERTGATATTLADGRVLIAGGDAAGSAEIHDPSTGQSTPLDATMVTPRANHSAILLADGSVLIVGGNVAGDGSVEGSAELFDPSIGRFTKTRGPMRVPTVQPLLTLRTDGVVEVRPERDAPPTEFYDPTTQRFGGDPAAAWVTSDRDDYAPGETVVLTGGRWMPGETVRITLRETPDVHSDRELFATTDASGAFVNTEFAPEAHDLGVTFHVTAAGTTSGREATTTFTDGAPLSATYTVTEGTGSILTQGTLTDVGIHCDDCVTRVPLPFAVTLYDETYTVAVVSSNGNVQFATADTDFANTALPARGFGAAIFPYWTDLSQAPVARSTPAYGIYTQTTGTAGDRVFHIWWHTLYADRGGDSANFELLLYENRAQFDIVYGGGVQGRATVGVQRSGSGPVTEVAPSPNINIANMAGVKLTFTGVSASPTTTALSSSAPLSVFGQPITFTATVSSSGAPVTNGHVTFTEGALVVAGPLPLNALGEASFTTADLAVGSHPILATFDGDATHPGSNGTLVHVVNKADTVTILSASENPSVYGRAVTLTATVSAAEPGAGTPTGVVVFSEHGTPICAPVALANGVATATAALLAAGDHEISAEYMDDENFNASSTSAVQTVQRATPAFSRLSSPTVPFGTATVAVDGVLSAGEIVPHPGTVTVTLNGVSRPAAIQADGTFATTVDTATLGAAGSPYALTFAFAGDPNFADASASSSLTVGKGTPTFGVVASASITYGDASAQLGGTIAAGALVPTGVVHIAVNGAATEAPIHPDGSFSAAFDTHALSASATPYAVAYSYGGDANFNPSTDAAGALTVRRRRASVVPNAASKTYGNADPAFSGTLSGFRAEDNVAAAYSRTAGESVLGRPYTISAALRPTAVLDNYDITFATAPFSITPATLAVVGDDQQKSAGTADPALTYHATGFRFADTPAAVLSGALTRDPGEAPGAYAIRQGTLAANANYTISFTGGTLTIGYGTCLLYDPNKAARSGSTLPIKLRLCSPDGTNLSSPSIVLTAEDIVLISTWVSDAVADAGDANPDNNFRFSWALGPGYIFNLKTTGLTRGTYSMRFHVTGDPMMHAVTFQVR